MIQQDLELKVIQKTEVKIVNDSFTILGDELAKLLLLIELSYTNICHEDIKRFTKRLDLCSEELDKALSNSRSELLDKISIILKGYTE